MSRYYINRNKKNIKKTILKKTTSVICFVTILSISLSISIFQQIQTGKNCTSSDDIKITKTYLDEKTRKNNFIPTADDQMIEPDGSQSPIRKYFTTLKILWTFDDYRIQSNDHPPHKGFGGLSERINAYGGHVNIMVIFTDEINTIPYGNGIQNYSVIHDFAWSQNHINASIDFFKKTGIYPQSHGWNHSENLNRANLSYAYQIINYTFWNLKNNYNITPHFFLGHDTEGNYNITLALKRFSDQYWTVYGEDFRWSNPSLFPNQSPDDPAVEYISKAPYVAMIDPLFGLNWSTPCKTLEEAQNLFNTSTHRKEIIFIRGHPKLLNGTDQIAIENLSKWQQWIDWIYQTHLLININHTEAIQYNVDRDNFIVMKNNEENYSIDLTSCLFDHNILFTNPDGTTQRNWTVYDQNGKNIGLVCEDVFLELKHNLKYFLRTQSANQPPITPKNPSPTNGFSGISVATDLSWISSDPENEPVTYDVYFGTSSNPPILVHNQSDLTYHPGTLNNCRIYYWKIVAWDTQSQKTTSPLWSFTTEGCSSGGGGGSYYEPENKKPIADASAGEPYQGSIYEQITFDGSRSSDPDGSITNWFWVFGDTTNGTGKTISHSYSNAGTYTVTLTVTDNEGVTHTDTTTCIITQPNRSPTIPFITGPLNGTKNTIYTYTALSADADNDTIQYTIDWGDPLASSDTSEFLPNGTSFTVNHSWTSAGRYDVTVTVTDNKSASSSTITVYIDAVSTGDIGYLLDNNGDGIYDGFFSTVTNEIVNIQKKDGKYNIDSDGDGNWDYTYDTTEGLMTYQELKTPGFELIAFITSIAIALLLNKRRRIHK